MKKITRAELDLIEAKMPASFVTFMFSQLPKKMQKVYNYSVDTSHDNALAAKWADYYLLLNNLFQESE